MHRLRLVFAAVALALLVPLALLVHKALASIEVERSLRHRTLAERIVDEMERELSMWLRREEDRPYAHYRYFYVPEAAAGADINLELSPLAAPPAEPFVIGYFQLDLDGTVGSPRVPRNLELARGATGWQPSPELDAELERVRAAVAGLWDAPAPASEPPLEQLAGTTVELENLRKGSKGPSKKRQSLPKEGALGALERLNRAAREREQRAAKVAPSQASNVYNFSQQEDNRLQQSIEDRQLWAEDGDEPADDAAARVTTEPAAADRDASKLENLYRGRLRTPAVEVEDDIEEALQAGAADAIEVRQEPMIGRRAKDGSLVLYRTVMIAGQAYRQGLVLAVPELVDWVAGRVLRDAELSSAARIVPAEDYRPSAAYAYGRVFAEPFATVASVVVLERLSEPPGTTYTYALALLLAAAVPLGLLALYRMVATRVAYAERRSNFVSSVTHELKTPLTAIRMYGEMLRDGVVPSEDKRQRYYEIMTAESERLTRLVNNVLELSRLERRDRPLQLVAGDLGPVLEEVTAVLAPHAEQEGFVLRLEVEPGLPQVRYDRDALTQVLFNLVDNAIKYSRRASDREIAITCRRGDDGVVLAVRDHGPGVARRHLKKIFEPFYRGENELTRSAKGTGIGLALVSGLVERMGGRVSGRNGDGGGFEVSVLLAPA